MKPGKAKGKSHEEVLRELCGTVNEAGHANGAVASFQLDGQDFQVCVCVCANSFVSSLFHRFLLNAAVAEPHTAFCLASERCVCVQTVFFSQLLQDDDEEAQQETQAEGEQQQQPNAPGEQQEGDDSNAGAEAATASSYQQGTAQTELADGMRHLSVSESGVQPVVS